MSSEFEFPGLAIIGGSGFEVLPGFGETMRKSVVTPYGATSSELVIGNLGGTPLVFLSRHGETHSIPPHRVNYRANIHGLKMLGVNRIISFAAVGGIGQRYTTDSIVVPDQLIDYTWGRQHTFYDGEDPVSDNSVLDHIEFASPFDTPLRDNVISAANSAAIEITDTGTYAVSQGPRLETAAEIDRMEKDGADIVGMTVMPEAALAREAGIAYATIAMVVNAAAGRGNTAITMQQINSSLEVTTRLAMKILEVYCSLSEGQTLTITPNRG